MEHNFVVIDNYDIDRMVNFDDIQYEPQICDSKKIICYGFDIIDKKNDFEAFMNKFSIGYNISFYLETDTTKIIYKCNSFGTTPNNYKIDQDEYKPNNYKIDQDEYLINKTN